MTASALILTCTTTIKHASPRRIITSPKYSRVQCDFGYGPGKIAVMKERMVFTIKRNDATEVQVERHGFVSLIYADVKTDYGNRCMTLHFPNKLLTDLTFPADGRLNPESLLVIVSRARSLKQIGLLCHSIVPIQRERTRSKISTTSLRSRVSRTTSH